MSKRVLQHPEVPANEAATSVWRSMREHNETVKFRHEAIREFYDGEDAMSDDERDVSRRSFVKLMGASTALAGMGLAACRRPESYILPYDDAPVWVVPGRPLFYATTMPASGGGIPLTVKSYENRPTMVYPNRTHPDNMGTDSHVGASILNLYSPSRSKEFLKDGAEVTKTEFEKFFNEFSKSPGKVGFVFAANESPTRSRLAREIQKKFSGSKFYSYEALENIAAEEIISQIFEEQGVKLTPNLEKADRILSLDSDFVELDAQSSTLGYSKKRQGGGENYDHEVDKDQMNRVYQVEAAFSLTGGMADHRLRVAPSQVSKVAVAVAKEVQKLAPNANLAKALAGLDAQFTVNSKLKEEALKEEERFISDLQEWVKACAKDLVAKKGKSLVVVGRQQPAELHALGVALNDALGAFDKILKAYGSRSGNFGSILDLKGDVDSGAVESLILLTPSNPLFDAAGEVDFAGILGKVKTSIHFGERVDKTAYACNWHIPATHYLESWGDALTVNGFYSVVQPLILPLYPNLVSEVDLLTGFVAGQLPAAPTVHEPSAGFYEVQTTFTKQFSKKSNEWNSLLKEGFVKARGFKKASIKAIPSLTKLSEFYATAPSADNLEVILAKDHSIADGRYIDNAWLQEAPDPIIKLTWDNVAIVSPKTAKELGIYDKLVELETKNAGRPVYNEAKKARAAFVKISVNEETLEIPVMVGFGQADYTITLPVGYGQAADDGRKSADEFDEARPVVGHAGLNTGFNVYPLRKGASEFLLNGAKITETNNVYKIACTQEHHPCMEERLHVKFPLWIVLQKGIIKSNSIMRVSRGWILTSRRIFHCISQKIFKKKIS